MRRRLGATLAAMLLALAGTTAWASDEPADVVPGRIIVLKTGKVAKVVAKPAPPSVFDLPDEPANDPVTEGGELRLYDVSGVGGNLVFDLPAQSAPLGWKRLPKNAAKPLKGFKYKGAGTTADPCKVVLVKEKVVKAVCRGAAVGFDPGTTGAGDVAVVLRLGADSKRYCALFGGTEVRNQPGLLKRKQAAGDGCTCAGSPTRLLFANGVGVGNCGTLTGGTINNDLACGGLYFGGGLETPDLPAPVGDSTPPTVMNVTCCTGKTLLLGPSTDAETTGDGKSCSSAGCFFGAPVPVVNASSIPTSTCLFNRFKKDAVGSVRCDTGEGSIDQPLATDVFLTGDALKFRCDGASPSPGVRCSGLADVTTCTPGACVDDSAETQPCPICNPVTNVCNGGNRNGLPCVVGTPAAPGVFYPTSVDCTVGSVLLAGVLDVPFFLTTGTSTKTAVVSGTQERVFCGFCRDADDTGCFQGDQNAGCPAGQNGVPVPCESDAACTDPAFEACEQRSEGAFGNGAATQIREIGSPAGSLEDFAEHPMTLVSVFCSAPTLNLIVDSSGDLPGPGATSLPGTVRLSPNGAFLGTEPLL